MNFTAPSRTRALLFFLSCLLLVFPSLLAAAEYKEDATGENYLFVKGQVHSVAPLERVVTIKPMKGARIKILLEQQTEITGFKTIEDLRPEDTVKVWYRETMNGLSGLKIIRMPDLGC